MSITGSHPSCETKSAPRYLKTRRVNGTSPDKCNQSLTASSCERPSGFRGGFPILNETVDQSSGVDRANRRHPRQTDPRTNGVGNFLNSSSDESMERKKILGSDFRGKSEDERILFGIYPGLDIYTTTLKFLNFSFDFRVLLVSCATLAVAGIIDKHAHLALTTHKRINYGARTCRNHSGRLQLWE
jgi:hypothetical protein